MTTSKVSQRYTHLEFALAAVGHLLPLDADESSASCAGNPLCENRELGGSI
jgi:hypothetical protein